MFALVGYHVHTTRELIHSGTLSSQVEYPNLRVRHTPAKSRLRVRLVLDVAIAASWTTSHFRFVQ